MVHFCWHLIDLYYLPRQLATVYLDEVLPLMPELTDLTLNQIHPNTIYYLNLDQTF